MKMLETDSDDDENREDYVNEFNNLLFGISNKPS